MSETLPIERCHMAFYTRNGMNFSASEEHMNASRVFTNSVAPFHKKTTTSSFTMWKLSLFLVVELFSVRSAPHIFSQFLLKISELTSCVIVFPADLANLDC